MKALPLSNKFSVLNPGAAVHIHRTDGICEIKKIGSLRSQNSFFLITFDGVFDIDAASRYEDSVLLIERDSVPLEEGEFFYDQIIGLSVITTEGAVIGVVADIFETGSNDVYVVRQDDREYLIPAIRDVVKGIDVENKRIVIQVMEGLLD